MTTDIERQFFETFGIEKINSWKAVDAGKMYGYERVKAYPQITDRILLELICIATASEITVEFKGIKNVEHLKSVVFAYCKQRYSYHLHKDKFKQQVQSLFKEDI